MRDQALNVEPGNVATAVAGNDELAVQAHRSLRVRRIKLAIITSALVRPLGLIVPMLTVPLFLNYLGSERYALFELVGALALWIALTDGGLASGLVNRLQTCHVNGDEVLARKYVSSLVVTLGTIALVAIALLSVAVPLIDWGQVFKTADPRAGPELPWAVWVAGSLTLLGCVSNVSFAVYSAGQEQHRAVLWDGVSRVATLVACFAVVHTRFGLVGALVATFGLGALIRLVNTVVLLVYEKPHLRPSLALFDFRLVRNVLGDGIYMFVLQLAVLAIFQSDRFVISTMLNTVDVVPYSIVTRIFIVAYGLFMVLLSPLWPAYGEAIRRGDLAWVRRGVRLATVAGCGGILAWGTVLMAAGKWIFPLWTRDPDVHVSRGLLLAMTATFVLRAWVDSRTVTLNSVAVYRPQVIFFLAHAVLNVGLAFLLARPFGVEGVAWATPISGLLTTAWGYPWLMRKFLHGGKL